MDIRLYDFDFNMLAIMSDCISSSWTIKYRGVGTYEGHFRLADRISDIFLKNRYLVIIEGDNQAICTGKIADGELLVCGRTVNWLLEKRIMPPFKTREIFGSYSDPYTIGNMVLERTFTAPPEVDEFGMFIADTVDEQKIVENFTMPAKIDAEPLERHFWRNSANSAGEILSDLAEMMGRGYRLFFNIDNKSWDFEYIEGMHRNILLSERQRNIYDVRYTEDLLDSADAGWYEIYSGEESDDGETVGKWRYIKKDSDISGMKFWETAFEVSGASKAESTLLGKEITGTVQGTVAKLKYKKDYDLGDELDIMVEYGNFSKIVRCQITGVNIWINKSGRGEEPIFKTVEEVSDGI